MATEKKVALRPYDKLSEKQKKFVDCYSGDARAALTAAGYKFNKNSARALIHQMMNNPKIINAIRDRERTDDPEMRKFIATRQQRQEWWTEVMFDPRHELRDRLKASELLGRSEADFTDKHVEVHATLEQMVLASMQGSLPPGTVVTATLPAKEEPEDAEIVE